MAESKAYTYEEVKAHESKKDLWMVIHDKVYSVASFVDEHPGGEEVLLDVAGQDATDSFEDVGHSDEAREILAGLLVGTLKRNPDDPRPKMSEPGTSTTTQPPGNETGTGITVYIFAVIAAAAGFGAYKYMQMQGA